MFNLYLLEPTQPPVQWVKGSVSLGIRWQEHSADYLLPFSEKFKNGEAIPPLLHTFLWRGARVIKLRDKITFYLYIEGIRGM
jgi:hypothetical protein